MLSQRTQIFLMHVYPNPFNAKAIDGIYTSKVSLLRQIYYLCKAGFLSSKKNSDHTATYFFTPEGILLTELLMRLPDSPQEYKTKIKLNRFEIN